MKKRINQTSKEAEKDRRVLHRLRSVERVLQGSSIKEVADRYGDSYRAVAYWVEDFKASGIEGLKEKPRTGRRDRLSPVKMKRLSGFVRKNRDSITGPMLSEYIKTTFGVTLTPRQCQRVASKILEEPKE